MCGVGKFLVIWKEQDYSACPRCGRFEDAVHVWRCQAATTKEIWKAQLSTLSMWLESINTAPAIMHAILLGLSLWYDPTHPHSPLDPQA